MVHPGKWVCKKCRINVLFIVGETTAKSCGQLYFSFQVYSGYEQLWGNNGVGYFVYYQTYEKRENYNTVIGKGAMQWKERMPVNFSLGFFLDQFEDPHCDLFQGHSEEHSTEKFQLPLETAAFWGVYVYLLIHVLSLQSHGL